MRIREAMQALVDGKQARLKFWDTNARLGFGACGELKLFSEIHPEGTLTSISQGEAESECWELYEPPPPKMTLVEAIAVVVREGTGRIRHRRHERTWDFGPEDAVADDWEVLP